MAKVDIELLNGERKRVTLKEARVLVLLKKAKYVKDPEAAEASEPEEKEGDKAMEAEPVTPRPRRRYTRRNIATGETDNK